MRAHSGRGAGESVHPPSGGPELKQPARIEALQGAHKKRAGNQGWEGAEGSRLEPLGELVPS